MSLAGEQLSLVPLICNLAEQVGLPFMLGKYLIAPFGQFFLPQLMKVLVPQVITNLH